MAARRVARARRLDDREAHGTPSAHSSPHSAGARITSVVELVDLYPTVAELAGVPLPAAAAAAAAAVQPQQHQQHAPSQAAAAHHPALSSSSYAGLGGRSLAALVERPRNSTEGAAISQIARCWPDGAPRDASTFSAMAQCDGVPQQEYAFFGYSIRTSAARFTTWVPTQWDDATARHMPRWDSAVASELYDHTAVDDLTDGWSQRGENANLAEARPAESAALRHRLITAVDATLREAASHLV